MAKKKKSRVLGTKSRPKPKPRKAKKSAAKKKTTKKKFSGRLAKKKKSRAFGTAKIIVAKKISKKPKRLKIKEVRIDVKKTVADIMSILPQTEPPSEGLCMKLCPKCNVDGYYGVCRMERGHIVSHRCDRCFNEWI